MKIIASLSVVCLLLVGTLLAQQSDHHGENGPKVKVLSSVDIAEQVDGKLCKSTTFEVTFEPGVSGTPHRHPGPIFGYVIEGEFEFAVDGQSPQKLTAGQTFYEQSMALHSTSRNPSDSKATRVLAVLVHPRDAKELVIPEPE
jgi:quercetin dioxygenase-like cupin family protein